MIQRLTLLAAVLGIVGCSSTPPPPVVSKGTAGGGHLTWTNFQEIAPAAQLDAAQASYASWGNPVDGFRVTCVVLTDIGDGETKTSTKTPRHIVGEQISKSGRSVKWECNSQDGESGTIRIITGGEDPQGNQQYFDLDTTCARAGSFSSPFAAACRACVN